MAAPFDGGCNSLERSNGFVEAEPLHDRFNHGRICPLTNRWTYHKIRDVKLPDELATEIEQFESDSGPTIQEIALRTTLSAIPFAGSALLELSSGLAQRRTQERLSNVFSQMKDRLSLLSEEKVDRTYFHSEEFQSLFYLLAERLHTTHDAEKLKMFGNALGNAGAKEFETDDKESFIRVLRDLSLQDLIVLKHEHLKGWTAHNPTVNIEYGPEVLTSLFRLQAMGLVAGKIKNWDMGTISFSTAPDAGMSETSNQPKMIYHLSGFGERFLHFISTEAPADGPPSVSS
jgi:hypothetical protein